MLELIHLLVEWLFAKFGRLFVKWITLGKVDLDLEDGMEFTAACGVGLIALAGILFLVFMWLLPQLP